MTRAIRLLACPLHRDEIATRPLVAPRSAVSRPSLPPSPPPPFPAGVVTVASRPLVARCRPIVAQRLVVPRTLSTSRSTLPWLPMRRRDREQPLRLKLKGKGAGGRGGTEAEVERDSTDGVNGRGNRALSSILALLVRRVRSFTRVSLVFKYIAVYVF